MMKLKGNKDFVLFIILIPLLLWGAFYISGQMERQLPDYAAQSKSGTGLSVFYEALKALKYPVGRSMQPLHNADTSNIQVIAQSGSFDIDADETRNWIAKGGTLVYLAPQDAGVTKYGTPFKKEGDITLYKHQKGKIIFSDAADITNQALIKDTDKAYELLKQMDSGPYNKIIFNEFYMFSVDLNQSLWTYIPIGYKFILYQLLLALVLYFYYKGKRFGKALPLYEETERIENEYLYSAASLYRQAKCWDIMLENYYKSFLKQAGCTHENVLDYWEREKLPSMDKVIKLHAFMESSGPKMKETEQMVAAIEQLKQILTKRRDSYWKTLKKTM